MRAPALAIKSAPPLLALLAAMALPSSAPAATAVSVNGSTVRATSDPGENNAIQVDLDLNAGDVVVDDAEGVTAAPPCVLSGGEAQCPLGGGGPTRIIVKSGNGRDSIVESFFLVFFGPLLVNADGSPPFVFNLGPGNDAAQGGLGSERILGEGGSDLMIGLDGDDTMIGGTGDDVFDRQLMAGGLPSNRGRDRYLAGPGADRIRARDFTRDLRIDCGPGRDRLSRDRFDPRPRRCP